MDYNGTSNVSPVRASSVTDKLFYKTEYKTSKEWSFIRFIKPASVWSGHVQYTIHDGFSVFLSDFERFNDLACLMLWNVVM